MLNSYRVGAHDINAVSTAFITPCSTLHVLLRHPGKVDEQYQHYQDRLSSPGFDILISFSAISRVYWRETWHANHGPEKESCFTTFAPNGQRFYRCSGQSGFLQATCVFTNLHVDVAFHIPSPSAATASPGYAQEWPGFSRSSFQLRAIYSRLGGNFSGGVQKHAGLLL